MQMKYRTLYHMKSTTEINTLQWLHENERQNIVLYEKHNRTLYHMKSTTEINTLQCLLENQVQKIVSYEKHNKN